MTRVAIAAAGAIAVTAVAAGTQEPFRGGTDLVSVYATVIDEDGRLVPDLTRDDFLVKDDGREQPITHFSNDVQPFSVVVLLDRSGSMADYFDQVREAARAFIGQLLPDDRARVGSFSNQISLGPEAFTGDHDALERILDEDLLEMGSSPVWTAIDRGMTALLPLSGRRVVLIFSDGHDDPTRGQVRTKLDDLVRRVRVNGIMVYSIGFAVESSRAQTRRSWIDPRNPRGPIRFPIPGGTSGRFPSGGLTLGKHYEPPDPGLRDLAEESGGGYFEMDETQDLTRTFVRVAEELHRQYWLGFAPRKLDGKTHEIEVKARRRGLDVRARRNYVASQAPSR